MARRCIQIHGGNGYMRDYGAEKLLRDALVMPIYEGTSQIQALMAMKDTLGGILKNPQEFVRRVAQARVRAVSSRGRAGASGGAGAAVVAVRAAAPHRAHGGGQVPLAARPPDGRVAARGDEGLEPEARLRVRHAARRAADPAPRRRGDRRGAGSSRRRSTPSGARWRSGTSSAPSRAAASCSTRSSRRAGGCSGASARRKRRRDVAAAQAHLPSGAGDRVARRHRRWPRSGSAC